MDSILAKESFHLPNIDMDQIPQTLDFFQENFSGIDNKKTHEPMERGSLSNIDKEVSIW